MVWRTGMGTGMGMGTGTVNVDNGSLAGHFLLLLLVDLLVAARALV